MPSIFNLNPAEWQGIAVQEIDLITNGLAGIGKIALKRGDEAAALGWDSEQTGALTLARAVIRASLPAFKPMSMVPIVDSNYGSFDVFTTQNLEDISRFRYDDRYVDQFHAFWRFARTMKGGGAFLPYVSLGFASPVEMMRHAGGSVDDVQEAHRQLAMYGTQEEHDLLAGLLFDWFDAYTLWEEAAS